MDIQSGDAQSANVNVDADVDADADADADANAEIHIDIIEEHDAHDEREVLLNRNGTNMILGSNGLMIEAVDSQALIIYNARAKVVEIKSAIPGEKIDLRVDGKVIINKDVDICSEIESMRNEIYSLRQENKKMKEMILECYYAPGMPGFITAQDHYERNLSSHGNMNENIHGNSHVMDVPM